MDEEAKARIEEQAKLKMKAWIAKEKEHGNSITNNERIFMRSRFQHKALVDEIVRGKRRAREENEDQEKKEQHLPNNQKEIHQGEQEEQITSSSLPQVLGKAYNEDKISV